MEQFIFSKNFSYRHFTTTKTAGNMKDKNIRNNFFMSLNLNPVKLVLANQTHGSNITIVGASDQNTFIDNCDGLITADKNTMIGIFTADCVLLLVACRKEQVKAAIHTGWKGLYGGIIENTFNVLKKDFSVDFNEVQVYIGPHILSCCYEVNCEVGLRFNVKLKDNKLDLSEIVYKKLKKLGIDNIFDIKRCTFHEKDLFFSYRYSRCDERIISII
ncbi:laccase domain protein [Endomicrobiia bacterium]|nr:laccase domain protein [Endomicrobiia bacterium]